MSTCRGRLSASGAALLLILAGPARGQDLLFRDARPAMGTSVALSVYAPDAATAQAAIQTAFDEIERIEQLLSDYRPTSELSRVNRQAFAGPVTVEPELFVLLELSQGLWADTGGAFDPAVGALVDAWGFRTESPSPPSPVALARARSASGMRHVALDPAARTVRFRREGLRLDPGAFGKGYAADRAARMLHEAGISRALVNAGASTFRALGPPPGEDGWIVHVRGDTVLLADAGLSISGQDVRQFASGSTIFGHILDPVSGQTAPVGRLSVVLAPDAVTADALSTALYVLGPERAAWGESGISALVRPGPADPPTVYRRHWPPTGSDHVPDSR